VRRGRARPSWIPARDPVRERSRRFLLTGANHDWFVRELDARGGVVFQENTLLAIAVGVGLAFVVTGVIEAVRHIRRRRNVITPDTIID
jgi:hypothetical protein